MGYAIYFDYNNATYRLPVNPEELESNSIQAIQKYEVLKLGQIGIPTHMELVEYSFECELPHSPTHYINTSGGFRNADFYLNLFKQWREGKHPVRFIASNGLGDDVNTLVLVEEVSTVERAGEEGDKYVSLRLVEYREFGKKKVVVTNPVTAVSTIKTQEPKVETSPKSSGSHVVVPGDTLWGLAKKYYGSGSEFGRIAEANNSIIKNPNLIYPGQRLVIP